MYRPREAGASEGECDIGIRGNERTSWDSALLASSHRCWEAMALAASQRAWASRS